jgi:hypothetical protein
MYDGQKGNNTALPGGTLWTVPELSFEKKQHIPELQQPVVSHQI